MNTCKEGCDPNPCLNDGFCNNEWGNGIFTCDCSQTSYTGKICNMGRYYCYKFTDLLNSIINSVFDNNVNFHCIKWY